MRDKCTKFLIHTRSLYQFQNHHLVLKVFLLLRNNQKTKIIIVNGRIQYCDAGVYGFLFYHNQILIIATTYLPIKCTEKSKVVNLPRNALNCRSRLLLKPSDTRSFFIINNVNLNKFYKMYLHLWINENFFLDVTCIETITR